MKICDRCVMDDAAPSFTKFRDGCNFCRSFLYNDPKSEQNERRSLESLVRQIKLDGRSNRYDCIVGVSGGVDSSFVLVKAVDLGLRPLAVHMDNTWNTNLANHNIRCLIEKLGVDLETYVIDWREYKAMLGAFLDADVLDIELLYDNALYGVNYYYAKKYRIKHLLGGMNHATEGIPVPEGWNWNKYDALNIKSIVSRNDQYKKVNYPYFSIYKFIFHKYVLGTQWHNILDDLEFRKDEALDYLIKNFGYKPYPYKHYESLLTRFYQGYILPKKFGVDKRKLHLSTLIMNGELNREDAVNILQHPPYDPDQLRIDKKFFLKRMDLTQLQFDEYIDRPELSHSRYRSHHSFITILKKIRKTFGK